MQYVYSRDYIIVENILTPKTCRSFLWCMDIISSYTHTHVPGWLLRWGVSGHICHQWCAMCSYDQCTRHQVEDVKTDTYPCCRRPRSGLHGSWVSNVIWRYAWMNGLMYVCMYVCMYSYMYVCNLMILIRWILNAQVLLWQLILFLPESYLHISNNIQQLMLVFMFHVMLYGHYFMMNRLKPRREHACNRTRPCMYAKNGVCIVFT